MNASIGPLRWCVLLLLLGCAGPPPAPPSAVIVITPGAVCAEDGFVTPVTLSGATSSGRLSLVPVPPEPGAPELTFRWRLSGDEHVIVSGGLDGEELEVLIAGERPLVVELTVDDGVGGTAHALRTVGFTVPTPCGDGCPDDQLCVTHAEGDFCVPDAACATDEECAACMICDAAAGHCVWEPM